MGDREISQEAGRRTQPGVAGKEIPTWAPPSNPLLPSCSQSSQRLLTWLAQPDRVGPPLSPFTTPPWMTDPSSQPPAALITGRSGPTQAAAVTRLPGSLTQWVWRAGCSGAGGI